MQIVKHKDIDASLVPNDQYSLVIPQIFLISDRLRVSWEWYDQRII